MHKFSLLPVFALALALLTSFTIHPVGIASAQQDQPVGVVVALDPGQSITIADQKGMQYEYVISSTVKILPQDRANSLAVGSFVTIIAPASLTQGKQMAVGIVVHPQIPNGWNVPYLTATPLAAGISAGTMTATTSGPLPDTQTPTPTANGTETATGTATASGVGTSSDTPTATPTPFSGNTAAPANTFIGWLQSLLSQLLSSR